MADEQQDTSEQSNQQAEDAVPGAEEGTLHTEESEPVVDSPTEGTGDGDNTQAGNGIALQDKDQPSELAIEQDKADELEGSDPDGDKMDPSVDQAQSSQEQTDSQDKQTLNGNDLSDQDENASPPDQDSNYDQPNQDIPPSQDFADDSPAVKSPDEDSKGSQTDLVENPGEGDVAAVTAKDQLEDGEADAALLHPEPDQPSENIDNATESTKVPDEGITTKEQNLTNLVESSGEGGVAAENENTAKDLLEDGEADAALLHPEPDQPSENIDSIAESTKVPDEGITANEQNLTNLVESPGEGEVAAESENTAKDLLEDGEADAAPETDQPSENIDDATEGTKVPDEGASTNGQNVDNEEPTGDTVQSNDNNSNVDLKETEEAAQPTDAPEDSESPDQPTVHESPSSIQGDQTITAGTPGSPSQINNDLNQGPISEAVNVDSPSSSKSPSPSPVKEEPTRAESTPGSLQQNNNNELLQGDDFGQFGSVHIPTAGVGDVDEVNGEIGAQYDLRDPASHKMRSSLPVNAYGDSRSRPLPAINPDPRLSRSLPPSTDPANIPEEYHNRSLSRGEGKHSRTHIPRIPSASGSSKAGAREGDVRRALNSAKLPPSVMKMSTVMVSARKRAVLNRHSSVFYEERHQTKTISLDEAINSRPPMPFDLDNPGPWSYSPRNKPLNETNAPEFTFGHRLREKGGGGRTANSKTWFNSKDGFTTKVHWDKRWPSPAHYNSTRPLLGRRKPTMLDYPNFSIGVKSKFSINKRGSENEPAPNEYNRSKSDPIILRRAPSYTISQRHQGTQLWSGKEMTPGPGKYTPRWGFNSGMIHHPSFTIQGVRRTKNHQLGPHSTF